MIDAYREIVRQAIWKNLAPLMENYSDVPYEHIAKRPRYSGLNSLMDRVADEIINSVRKEIDDGRL